jgi:hypothetical protein
MKAHLFFGSGLSTGSRDASSDEIAEPFFVEPGEAMRMLQEGHIQNGGAALAVALYTAQKS